MAGDVVPYQRPGMDPADANAGGSIGIIVDFLSNDSVVTVGTDDDGTLFNPETGDIISGGYAPTLGSCARSIDERTTSNEWLVRGYRTVGIFAFGPIWVRHPSGGEAEIAQDAALLCFPQFRAFSVLNGQFVEFDRGTGQWSPIYYDAIMNAVPLTGEQANSAAGQAAQFARRKET